MVLFAYQAATAYNSGMKKSYLLILFTAISGTALGLSLFFGISFSLEIDRVIQRDLDGVVGLVELHLDSLDSSTTNAVTPSILFESLQREHPYITEANLLTYGAGQQWSLVDGAAVDVRSDIVRRLRQQRQVRIADGHTIVVYRRYRFAADETQFTEPSILKIAYDTTYYRIMLQRFHLRSALITLILIILSSFLAGLFLGRRLIAPVSIFRRALLRAGAGVYTERLSLDHRIPEYREIAAAFNSLLSSAVKREYTLEKQAADLSDSLEQRDVLLREIHHRVKNNLQIITSIISIEQSRGNPATVEILSHINTRVSAMSMVHEILYDTDNLMGVCLEELVERVFCSVVTVYGLKSQECAFSYNLLDVSLPIDVAIPLALVVTEAITNSLQYGRGANHVTLRVSAYQLDINEWCVAIKDNGSGFPDDIAVHEGLGMVLMRGLTEQINGRLNLYNNNGAIVELTLPVYGNP